MKTCSICKRTKPFYEFGNNSSTQDGLTPQCLVCRRKMGRRNQAKYKRRHPDRVRKSKQREYIVNPERIKASVRQWQDENRDRLMATNRARARVAYAIKAGRLVRPGKCENCGRVCTPEAAHYDYSKPLEVRWLCRRCHRLWDRRHPKSINQ